jgi:glutaconate CoA-transferase subunit A
VTAIAVAPGRRQAVLRARLLPRDNAFYVAWDAISRDRGTFQACIAEHVLSRSAEVAS